MYFLKIVDNSFEIRLVVGQFSLRDGPARSWISRRWSEQSQSHKQPNKHTTFKTISHWTKASCSHVIGQSAFSFTSSHKNETKKQKDKLFVQLFEMWSSLDVNRSFQSTVKKGVKYLGKQFQRQKKKKEFVYFLGRKIGQNGAKAVENMEARSFLTFTA